MIEAVTFDPVTHVYTIGGRVLPSVTQIINAVIPRQWSPDPWYMDRGTMIHKAVALMLRKELDESSLDPRIIGYVAAAKAFWATAGIDGDLDFENPMADQKRGFAGTPDLLGGDNEIVDWKSGTVDATAEIQLGGYAVLTNPIAPSRRRLFAVELHEDGTFTIFRYEERRAYGLFMNVLSVYQWMKIHGKLPERKA